MNEPRVPARKIDRENSFGSRVRRYAQVGGTVGVQAARIAGATRSHSVCQSVNVAISVLP